MTNKTIILATQNNGDPPTRELILRLFEKDVDAVYRTQQDIAQAIYSEFGKKRKQAAISKALTKMSNRTINYNGADYHIVKVEDGYMLLRKDSFLQYATQKFADKKMFDSFEVYRVNKNIVAYTIKARYHKYVKDCMLKIYKEDAFFDIISHGNKLYFLLSTKDGLSNKMYEIPQIVKTIDADNQKKTLTATRVVEKYKKQGS
jgi:hypothetical protein